MTSLKHSYCSVEVSLLSQTCWSLDSAYSQAPCEHSDTSEEAFQAPLLWISFSHRFRVQFFVLKLWVLLPVFVEVDSKDYWSSLSDQCCTSGIIDFQAAEFYVGLYEPRGSSLV